MPLPTLKVVDADGATKTPNTLPPAGQATMAESLPVALASDQPPFGALGFADVVSASFNRPANTSAYTAADIVADNVGSGAAPMQFSVGRINGGAVLIRGARITVNKLEYFGQTFRLHLFTTLPAFTNGDNFPFNGNVSESGWIGSIDVVADTAFSNTLWKGAGGPLRDMLAKCAGGSKLIYGVLQIMQAVSPGSGNTFTVDLEVIQVS